MADLSHVADATKKIVRIAVIGVIALVLLFLVFKIGVIIKDIVSPTPPPPPSVSFGKLEATLLPQNPQNITYTYSLNTLTGALPALPDRVTVYKLQQPSPDLLGLDKAKSIAENGGFLTDPAALSDTSYQWSKTDPFPTTLTMDTQSFDFTMISKYQTDPTVTQAANLPDEPTAQAISKEFFDKIMPLPASIDDNKTKTTIFAITPNGLTPATSLSGTQIIRVDYFPEDIDKIPIYTDNPDESLIYALVASGPTTYPQIVEAQYYHKNITNDKATYPIKTATEAFNDLKQGNGYIAANPTDSSNVTITDVTLGYYVNITPQQYLWPIIVFQGDKGFYAYVSAIPDEWVQK